MTNCHCLKLLVFAVRTCRSFGLAIQGTAILPGLDGLQLLKSLRVAGEFAVVVPDRAQSG